METYLDLFKGAQAYCWSQDTLRKKIGRVIALPWADGLSEIGL